MAINGRYNLLKDHYNSVLDQHPTNPIPCVNSESWYLVQPEFHKQDFKRNLCTDTAIFHSLKVYNPNVVN